MVVDRSCSIFWASPSAKQNKKIFEELLQFKNRNIVLHLKILHIKPFFFTETTARIFSLNADVQFDIYAGK
jgi:hypothetical protein